MSTPGAGLTPREGDIVRTSDGHLWRVTRIHAGVEHVAAITRLGDHIEMAARLEDLAVVEAHPGGAGAPPLHRTETQYHRCATCDGGGCHDCTEPA